MRSIAQTTAEDWDEIGPAVMRVMHSVWRRPDFTPSERGARVRFQHPRALGFVAREGGEILGYVIAIPRETGTYVSSFAVLKDYRAQGIGGQLLDSLIMGAREAGHTCVLGHFGSDSERLMSTRGAEEEPTSYQMPDTVYLPSPPQQG